MREKAGDESALRFVCFGREVGVRRGCVLLVLMLEKQSVRMQYLTRSKQLVTCLYYRNIYLSVNAYLGIVLSSGGTAIHYI